MMFVLLRKPDMKFMCIMVCLRCLYLPGADGVLKLSTRDIDRVIHAAVQGTDEFKVYKM